MGKDLVLLAVGASHDVVFNPLVHTVPLGYLSGFLYCLVLSRVAHCMVIVDQGHNRSFLSLVGSSIVLAVDSIKRPGDRTLMPWLSPFPWSTPGGQERASGTALAFPSMGLIS